VTRAWYAWHQGFADVGYQKSDIITPTIDDLAAGGKKDDVSCKSGSHEGA
jgi:hypothetical protein